MINVYIFKTYRYGNLSEFIAIIPFDCLSRWVADYQFDLSCCYQFHFVKDGKTS